MRVELRPSLGVRARVENAKTFIGDNRGGLGLLFAQPKRTHASSTFIRQLPNLIREYRHGHGQHHCRHDHRYPNQHNHAPHNALPPFLGAA
jgi:hypothetical protein